MTEPPRTPMNYPCAALIAFFMLLWLIWGAAMSAVGGDFPRGF